MMRDISLLPLHSRAAPHYIGYCRRKPLFSRRLSVFDNLMAVLQGRDDLTQNSEKTAPTADGEFHIEHLRDNKDRRVRW